MKKKTKSHFHVDFMSGDGDNFPQQNGFVKGGCNYVVDRIHTLNTLENGGLFSDFGHVYIDIMRLNIALRIASYLQKLQVKWFTLQVCAIGAMNIEKVYR